MTTISFSCFLSAFFHGKTPEETMPLSCATAAISVQTPDVVSGMKPFAEVEVYKNTLTERLPVNLSEAEGWKEIEDGLWEI